MANNLVNGETFAFVPNEDMAPVDISSRITSAYAGITRYVWQCGHVVSASLAFNRISSDGADTLMNGFPAPASGRIVLCVIGKDDGTVVPAVIQSNGAFRIASAFDFTSEGVATITYLTNDMSAYKS